MQLTISNNCLVKLIQRSTWFPFILSGNRIYPVDYALDQLEAMLDPGKYFRISRKYIVSIDACTNMAAWTNSRIRLKIEGIDDPAIIVARERVQDFKNWLDR